MLSRHFCVLTCHLCIFFERFLFTISPFGNLVLLVFICWGTVIVWVFLFLRYCLRLNCLCFPNAKIKSMCHGAQPSPFLIAQVWDTSRRRRKTAYLPESMLTCPFSKKHHYLTSQGLAQFCFSLNTVQLLKTIQILYMPVVFKISSLQIFSPSPLLIFSFS